MIDLDDAYQRAQTARGIDPESGLYADEIQELLYAQHVQKDRRA